MMIESSLRRRSYLTPRRVRYLAVINGSRFYCLSACDALASSSVWRIACFGRHEGMVAGCYPIIRLENGGYVMKKMVVLSLAGMALAVLIAAPASFADGGVAMHRLYNPNSGEHFYTASAEERDWLVGLGWNHEGAGWIAPETSSTPVFRLYNANAGDHHYTMSAEERDWLVGLGWNDEGIGWYSDDAKTVPLYREYNPNAFANNHNYTADASEHEYLLSIGWNDEGIGWYGIAVSGGNGNGGATSGNAPNVNSGGSDRTQGHNIADDPEYEGYNPDGSRATRHEEIVEVVDQEAWDEPEYGVVVMATCNKCGATMNAEARDGHACGAGFSYHDTVVQTGVIHHPAVTHQEVRVSYY